MNEYCGPPRKSKWFRFHQINYVRYHVSLEHTATTRNSRLCACTARTAWNSERINSKPTFIREIPMSDRTDAAVHQFAADRKNTAKKKPCEFHAKEYRQAATWLTKWEITKKPFHIESEIRRRLVRSAFIGQPWPPLRRIHEVLIVESRIILSGENAA